VAIEIVDLPIENGGSFHSFLLTFARGYHPTLGGLPLNFLPQKITGWWFGT